jgi:long-chain acyl-CoA synthetase
VEDRARDPVRAAAQRRPDATALIAGAVTLSWADVDARVDVAARRLLELTSAPGDRVALVLGNTIDFAVAYFGILRAGLVAVPLNPGYTADELMFALTDSGAVVVVADDAVRGRLRLAQAVAVPPDLGVGSSGSGSGLPDVSAGQLAVLLYTSGTSGRPKGAMLSHGALAANHDQLERIEPPVVGPDDVVLLAVPFFHAYGLNTGLGTVAQHGAAGVLVDRFDAEASLELIARHGVTVAVGVPWSAARPRSPPSTPPASRR